jgi:hypothetical protein
MFPPFILPSAQHTRLVFESISVEGAATSAQIIFRTVLQSITSSSGVWDSITAAPAEIFQRFASAVLEIVVGTPGVFHSPAIVPEPSRFPWILIIGLLLGILLLILYWYSRRRGAGGLHVVLDDEQPPPPLDQPPQPVPVPAMG